MYSHMKNIKFKFLIHDSVTFQTIDLLSKYLIISKINHQKMQTTLLIIFYMFIIIFYVYKTFLFIINVITMSIFLDL